MNVVIRAGTSIGSADADDDDEFLFEGFVHLPQFADILDVTKNKSILIGRTGSGKTALIRFIERKSDNVIRLDPRKIAMDHIANSNILSFLESLKVDLHLFYELLWKHVIRVALIKKIFNVTSEQAEATFFDQLRASLGGKRNKIECLEYLRSWGKSFWIDADVQVREIVSKIEDQIKASVEAGIPNFKFSASATVSADETQKKEITQRAQKIVNDIQIGKLNQVIDLLADTFQENRQRKYFVCIDNLDERWIDVSIQFKLIRALIEIIRSFRRVQQLKIVLALRSDVYERALTETRDLGFQKEKYDSYVTTIRWNEADLTNLVNERLNILYKNQYSSRTKVSFDDVFAPTTRNERTINYIITRTLFRPRDVIAFVNQCFESAQGQTSIPPKTIQLAEQQYSRRRGDALIEEWQSVHPELDTLIDFLKGRGQKISISEIAVREVIEQIVTNILMKKYDFDDDLIGFCNNYLASNNMGLVNQIATETFSILYKVGAISLKLMKQQPYQFSYKDDAVIPRNQIAIEGEARISPMLWRALGITPNL